MSLAVKFPAAVHRSAGVLSAPVLDEDHLPGPGRRKVLAAWGVPLSAWLMAGLMWTLIIGLSLLVVGRHAAVAGVGVDMTLTRERIDRLTEENLALEAQVGEMQSISRIERVATSRLGMVKPASFRTVAIDRTVLGQSTAPATGLAAATTGASRPGQTAAAGGR